MWPDVAPLPAHARHHSCREGRASAQQGGAGPWGGRRPTQPRDPSWPTRSLSCSPTCSVTRTQNSSATIDKHLGTAPADTGTHT